MSNMFDLRSEILGVWRIQRVISGLEALLYRFLDGSIAMNVQQCG